MLLSPVLRLVQRHSSSSTVYSWHFFSVNQYDATVFALFLLSSFRDRKLQNRLPPFSAISSCSYLTSNRPEAQCEEASRSSWILDDVHDELERLRHISLELNPSLVFKIHTEKTSCEELKCVAQAQTTGRLTRSKPFARSSTRTTAPISSPPARYLNLSISINISQTVRWTPSMTTINCIPLNSIPLMPLHHLPTHPPLVLEVTTRAPAKTIPGKLKCGATPTQLGARHAETSWSGQTRIRVIAPWSTSPAVWSISINFEQRSPRSTPRTSIASISCTCSANDAFFVTLTRDVCLSQEEASSCNLLWGHVSTLLDFLENLHHFFTRVLRDVWRILRTKPDAAHTTGGHITSCRPLQTPFFFATFV